MNYYAGLDVSLERTHICVLDRNGTVILEASAASTPASAPSVGAATRGTGTRSSSDGLSTGRRGLRQSHCSISVATTGISASARAGGYAQGHKRDYDRR